ncbi:hypothetical protein BKA70DRAFT_1416842 [Coprinopsis sp. MPI-PUGE-AT-0042]|nr:hypothetical protein BKA70DRAFT_1416842 [Coprinopsis sp. MPI-PUGE-AT-0042]
MYDVDPLFRLWCICLAIFQVLAQLLSLLAGSRLGHIWLCLAVLPLALGHPTTSPYPDIPFSTFSAFILSTFDPKISLASVMIILSSVLENPELLNLHFRRILPLVGREQGSTAWMEHFASRLAKRFPAKTPLLPRRSETTLSTSLVNLAKLLHLNPYDKYDLLVNKCKPIDLSSVEPSLAIVSKSYECQNQHCRRYSLFPHMKKEEIAQVTPIKGAKPYSHAFAIGGCCDRCKTSYMADHTYRGPDKTFINDAPYLKIGNSRWGDRVFTQSVCHAIYSFHASAQAFTEYFNNSYSCTPSSFASLQSTSTLISHRHSWQAFMQESLRMVSGAAGHLLTVALKTSVDLLAKRAYTVLGQGGKLSNAQDHACIDCTQPWRSDAKGDPYAMEEEDAWVNMHVVDGIVTGPYHCAYPDCDQPLANYREWQVARNPRLARPKLVYSTSQSGIHMLQHTTSCILLVSIASSTTLALPWQNRQDGVPNPHDQPDAGVPLRKNYFSPGKFYCVETLHSSTINHSKDDSFCQDWCDPAPSDGSPNLVIMKRDAAIWLQAFNTQACEQLNAWLASYDSILKRMTLNNFNWFLHAILFLHAKKVLVRQEQKMAKAGNNESEESTDDSEESTDDSESDDDEHQEDHEDESSDDSNDNDSEDDSDDMLVD